MRQLIAFSAVCCVAAPAWALKEPEPGKRDPRMETAAYDPAEVYAVHVPQGQTLAIVLAPSEIATDGFGADNKQLRADISGNVVMLWSGSDAVPARSMFIRSRLADGTTRTYALQVDTRPPENAAVSVTFTYPSDDAAKRAAAWKAAVAARGQKAAVAALAAARGAEDVNFSYVLQGATSSDWTLLPSRRVSDNGTDTHFFFPGNMRVPIIYAVSPDGKEALADYTFDSTTGVASVHQLARAFHLRDGDSLLCVFNKAFDPIGISRTTGTISAGVERVLK